MTMAQPRLFITLLLPLWSRPEKSLHTVARRRYFLAVSPARRPLISSTLSLLLSVATELSPVYKYGIEKFLTN